MKHSILSTAVAAASLAALSACGGTSGQDTSEPETEAPAQDAATSENAEPAGQLNIYSARHYESDRLIYEAFQEDTGIEVRSREANANQLVETMRAEGAASPADVVIASDAGALWMFEEAGLLQPVQSDMLEGRIPQRLRHPDGQWFGLARRLRGVAYDPERIEPDQVDQWEDLADPALEGEICVRSSSNIYNLSLMGEMIERWGNERAADWAEGVVANMARAPQGGDTNQIEAVGAGLCSIAITNHYYWVRLLENGSPSQREAAGATELVFPEFGDAPGVHVNMTGAGVAANAPNRDAAIRFIEYLTTPEAQTMLTTQTKEIPVSGDATMPEGLDAIPDFEASEVPVSVFGTHQAEAQRIYDRAGWN